MFVNMENDETFNERQSIRDSARQLKKYGSTCNHVRNNEYLVRHDLEQTDTLQGIALKYGCTTEQIRRVNRLFAQDSLFLRQYLMIPVDRDKSIQHSQFSKSLSPQVSNTLLDERNGEEEDEEEDFPTSMSTSPPPASSHETTVNCISNSVLSPEEENKKSIEDFLGKIDSTLAKTKNYVKNSQSSLNGMISQDDNDLEGTHSAASYALSSSYQNSSGSNNNNNINQTVVTQGRRVKSSLHRLEEQQDEFYQL